MNTANPNNIDYTELQDPSISYEQRYSENGFEIIRKSDVKAKRKQTEDCISLIGSDEEA